MSLYPHDCSYLFTEYGRRKEMESYEIENRPDELLAACKRALSFLYDVPLGMGNDHELMQCQLALKNAIAKAEK